MFPIAVDSMDLLSFPRGSRFLRSYMRDPNIIDSDGMLGVPAVLGASQNELL